MTPKSPSPVREIVWFLFFLVAFSAPVSAFLVHLGFETPMTSRMIMWCPGMAALATCLTCQVKIGSLGWAWPRGSMLSWGYFSPWLYAIPIYLFAWLTIPGAFQWTSYSTQIAHDYHISEHATAFAALFGIPTTLTFLVIGDMAWALGEELGWRGFLVPRLHERLGFFGTGVSSGLLWAVWHYPSLLGANYNAGTPPIYAVTCFTIMVVSLGIIMAWLRLASGSLWPCVLLHASHNTLIQGVLDALTAKSGRAPYITTEFGAGLAISTTLIALWLVLRLRKRLQP